MKQFIPAWLGKLVFKSNFDRLSVDQLRRKMIALQLAEKRACSEIERGEKVKAKLFEENSSKSSSDRQRLQAAYKIREMERKLQALEQQWTANLKNQRIVEGLLQMKTRDNRNVVDDFGLNAEEIAVTLEDERIQAEISNQRADAIVDTINDSFASDYFREIPEDVRMIMDNLGKESERNFQDKAFEGAQQAAEAHHTRSHVFSENELG
ncbi:MAG: hypothetical protein RLY14_3287 [Planctomycetota bacterium]|jgi:hypothetical protein